jgi:hypothetical protein
MTTIQAVHKTPAAYTPAVALDAPATTPTSFSQSLSAVQTPQSWLTTAEASRASRPNFATFMGRTGAPFLDASEMLNGVVGSNTDVRDWAAIMASDDPMTAARQATAQMYGRTDITPRSDASYMNDNNTLAREGNFAIRQLKDSQGQVIEQGLKLIDAQGLVLRDAGGSAKKIARNAWLFGFDTQPLAKLTNAASSVSESLGKAVTQASQMNTASAAMASTRSSTVKTNLAANNSANVMSLSQTVSRSSLRADPMRGSDRGSAAPALEEATARQRAPAAAPVDSARYLRSLFRA